MEKLAEYYSFQRNEVAAFVPSSTKTILDVGCGQGFFLKLIKETISAETWGIEFVPNAAEKANQIVDKVICSKIEDAIFDLPDNYFDCITFNDVLEHLIDPMEILVLMRTKLTANGVLISSIPNVRHIDNLKELIINKDWQYVDKGILDSTHLRFFTQKSMRRLYEMSGYRLENQSGINETKNYKFKLFNMLTLGFFDDTKYLQYVLVGKSR